MSSLKLFLIGQMATNCYRCKKEFGLFSRIFTCRWCGKKFCSNCIEKVDFKTSEIKYLYILDEKEIPEDSWIKSSYVLCPECARKFNREIERISEAIMLSDKVELVSINYKGKKNYYGIPKRIFSDWHEDKEDCKKDLKMLAALYSYSIVIDVNSEYDIEEDGNYKYKIFRMTGWAYKKN